MPWPFAVSSVGEEVTSGALAFRFQGVLHAVIVAKTAFSLVHDGLAKPARASDLLHADLPYDKNPARSVRLPSDLALHRPSVDVTLVGHAYAPAGRPVPATSVRLAIFRERAVLDKTLHVYGDRSGAADATTTRPFQRMPIVFERAMRGADNPLGVDPESSTPNLVDPRDAKRPACFGPISRYWRARKRLLAGLDSRRIDADIPDLPDGFDWDYFQSAPPDQRIEALHGDEWILLDGLHPAMPRVQTKLASGRALARVHELSGDGAFDAGRLLALRADALIIDADAQTCEIVYRASFPVISGESGLARFAAFVGIERPGTSIVWPDPRALERRSSPAAKPPVTNLAVGEGTLGMSSDDHAVRARAPAAPFRGGETSSGEPRSIGTLPGAPWIKGAALPAPRLVPGQEETLHLMSLALPPPPPLSTQESPAAARWFHQASAPAAATPESASEGPRTPVRTSPNVPIIHRTSLVVATIPWQIRPPQDSLTILVKGTFDLVPDGPARPRAETEAPTGDVHAGDDPEKPLLYPSDFAIFKPRADVTLTGDAAPPKGARTAMPVSFRFGTGSNRFERTLSVFGDRTWEHGLLGESPSEAKPFERIPLSWEFAFGGPRFAANPKGRGHSADGAEEILLPNIESPTHLIRSTSDVPEPVCFAPVPLRFATRWSKLGTFDGRWQKTRWPYFPEDFDWSFFQCAPDAQRLNPLVGNESFEIAGVHTREDGPGEGTLRGSLPGIRVRCFASRRPESGGSLDEVPLLLDSVHFDTNAGTMNLVWRGALDVSDEEAPEIAALFVLTEPLADPQATLPQVRDKLDALLVPLAPVASTPEEPPANDAGSADEAFATMEAETRARTDAVFEKLRASGVGVDAVPTTEDPPPMSQTIAERLRAAGVETKETGEMVEALRASEASAEKDAGLEDVRARAVALLEGGGPLDGADLADGDLSGLDFSDRSLVGTNFARSKLRAARFARARLAAAQLAGCDLADAVFDGANIEESDFQGARLDGARFVGARLVETSFIKASCKGCRFDRAVGSSVDYAAADLSDATFGEATIAAADFSGALLDRASFLRATMLEPRLYDARGRSVVFDRARLGEARADGVCLVASSFAHSEAEGSVWENATLDGSTFARAKLSGASFVRASCLETIFVGASLVEGRFERARLAGAVFRGANLMNADLGRADLTLADLSGANLYGTETWRAKVDHVKLDGAIVAKSKLGERR